MTIQQPTVNLFLDRSRPGTDGKCLIKLNIYFKPDKKRYATKFHATEDEWIKLNGTNLRDPELKKLKKSLNDLRAKAEVAANAVVPFSPVTFEELFFGNSKNSEKKGNSLKGWFDDCIQRFKSNGQISSAVSYRTSYNSLSEYKKNLNLQDITPAFLRGYESHMLKSSKSAATIGIYLRPLRAVINQAINEKVISRDHYPFNGYTVPASRNVKKALENEDLKRLLEYKAENADDQKAVDFWKLSYLLSGINFADIVELTPSNLQGELLVFTRVKTKRTKKGDLRPIKIGVPPAALELIRKYQNTDPSNPYLFPILEAGLKPETARYRKMAFIKWVNKRMKAIGVKLNINIPLTTYAARHSFSTVMKRKGMSTEFIKDSLGHSSVATTENYLGSFADDVMVKNANLLTDL